MDKLDFDEIAELWIMHTPRGTLQFGFKVGEGPKLPEKKPEWMTKFRRYWDKPNNPVTMEFTLAGDEYIQDAIDFFYNNNSNLDEATPKDSEEA